ncbi:hypothetical protein ABW19_dt0206948 [Dactylella cylindrospora]|nr:hypothetical protein ABW19_dt0206948 [Dactylella cylindrospora]
MVLICKQYDLLEYVLNLDSAFERQLVTYGCCAPAPLKIAMQDGSDISIVRLLMERGADPNAKILKCCDAKLRGFTIWGRKCADTRTPLHYAVERGDIGLAKYLLEKGAKIGISGRVSYYDMEMDAAEYAAYLGRVDIIFLFLHFDIDCRAKALEMAVNSGKEFLAGRELLAQIIREFQPSQKDMPLHTVETTPVSGKRVAGTELENGRERENGNEVFTINGSEMEGVVRGSVVEGDLIVEAAIEDHVSLGLSDGVIEWLGTRTEPLEELLDPEFFSLNILDL